MAVPVAVIEKLMISRPAKVLAALVIAAAVPEIMELAIARPSIRKATIGATPIARSMIDTITLGKTACRRPAIRGTGPTIRKATCRRSLHSGTCDSRTCRTPLSKPTSRRTSIGRTGGATICKSTGRRGGAVVGGRNRRTTKPTRCKAMIGRTAARWGGGGGALAHYRMSVIAMIAILRRSRRHRTAKQRCRESQRQSLSESD